MLTGLLYAMKGEIESLLPPDAAPERTEAGVLFYRLRPDLVACCGYYAALIAGWNEAKLAYPTAE